MKKAIIYYLLAVVSAVIAVIIFMKSFNWLSLLILLLGVAAALLFRQGIIEAGRKE